MLLRLVTRIACSVMTMFRKIIRLTGPRVVRLFGRRCHHRISVDMIAVLLRVMILAVTTMLVATHTIGIIARLVVIFIRSLS